VSGEFRITSDLESPVVPIEAWEVIEEVILLDKHTLKGFKNPDVQRDQEHTLSVQRGRLKFEFLPTPTSELNPADSLTLKDQLEIKRVECKFHE
jgi:hypothetical protein